MTLNVQNQIFGISIALALAGNAQAQQAPSHDHAGPAADCTLCDLRRDVAQTRERLAERGVTFGAALTADFSKNISGGASHAGTQRHLFDFFIELDMHALAGIEGGTFLVDFQTQNGQDGSVETGDLQAYSNIDSDDFTALYEVWYQHVFMDGDARIKVGKFDANSEFAYVEHGGSFIHSSPGYSPTLFVLPTYADPAFGIAGFIGESQGLYASAAVFDGAVQEGITTGTRGPSTLFDAPADLFFIGELGYRWGESEDALPGRLAGGVWHHTGTFTRFSGGSEDNTTGFYLLLDQMLYRENPGVEDDAQGIGLFAQYGWADEELNAIEHHVGLGAQWTGLIPERDEDVLGLMASWASLSDEPGAGFTEHAEAAFELFYQWQVCSNLAIKPDIQYIVNPGGAGLDDAWVTTLRLELTY